MLSKSISFIQPQWPAPSNVKAIATTRKHLQGASLAENQQFNLGENGSDDPLHAKTNRALLRQTLPAEPLWLNQVHGKTVIRHKSHLIGTEPPADGCFTTLKNQVCTVMTADCLPILLCDVGGHFVAAIHAGWKGLYAGIIEQAVNHFVVEKLSPVNQLLVWMGPAISQARYQVDDRFRDRFINLDPYYENVFSKKDQAWYADLYAIARYQFKIAGIEMVYGGEYCTSADENLFYSHRRDHGKTGRQASLIWLE